MSWLKSLLLYHDHEPRSAAMNMAVDEALLEAVSIPSLRFYRWQRPSLSFGYFGLFARVAPEAPQRDIVRRWTGGGIVLHGSDLTYSIILPNERMKTVAGSRSIYREVHQAICRALSSHLAVELAKEDAPILSEACFANPVTADVLADGKKIAGAAQRRTHAGLLHQGSIQCQGLPASFTAVFARELCLEFTREELPPQLLSRAGSLAREKYATPEWLQRR